MQVDRSVIEAFAMGGRGSMIRRVYPKQFNESVGAALVYNTPRFSQEEEALDVEEDQVEPPLVSVTVWEMGSGYS